MCYKYVKERRTVYYSAYFCGTEEAYLAAFKTKHISAVVFSYTSTLAPQGIKLHCWKDMPWIGAYSSTGSSNWTLEWSWSDHSGVINTFWCDGEPQSQRNKANSPV
uniref:C-type lectin domain-containing protein n=1 Tax=Steinernema glaseri TaxID=37863 RepID=A0A1I7Y893_9BILA